jgi:uncharacterized membrane protein YphA (DoxX/SURF4 family)
MPSLPLPDTRSAVGPAVQPGWGWTSTTVVLPKRQVSQASNGSDARPRRAPWPQAATVAWLMYASAALAGLSIIVGVSTLPALRSILASQHPAASGAVLGSATRIAVVVLLARGLATGGLWLWAGWQARRDQGRDRMLAFAAFAVTTIGVVASYLQVLSTGLDRLIGVASWVAALGTVIVLGVAPAVARRRRHARSAG